MVFEAISGRLGLDSGSWSRALSRAESSATSFGSTATGAFDRVGDAASDSALRARAAGSGFDSLGESLRDSSIAATLAGSRIDEAGDEAATAGAQAGAGATGFGALAASTDGLRLSMGAVSGSIVTVTAAVGGLMTALAPLAATAGLAAGAVGGLAAAFGAIIGTGILAFGEKRAKQNKKQLKQVKSKISSLEKLKSQNDGLSKSQQKTLANLKEQKKELKKGTSAMGGFSSALKEVGKELKPVIVSFGSQFVPIIQDALDTLPAFVKSLLDATGNLKPFTSALRDLGGAAASILPKLLGLFIDTARQALPAFRAIGTFISGNLVPALRGLFTAGRNAAGPVMRLGTALGDLLGSIGPIAGLAGRLVLRLYDIAAAGARAGASLTSGFLTAVSRGVQTLASWGSTIQSAVVPVLSQLASAWQGQGSRIMSVAAGMGEQIHETFVARFGTAAQIAKGLLTTLSSLWQTHGAAITSTLRVLSRNLSELLVSAMAAVSAAVQGDMVQMRSMIQQGASAILGIWRPLWAQFPAPVRRALSLVSTVLTTLGAAVRGAIQTAVSVGLSLWRQFGSQTVSILRSRFGQARTAVATFATTAAGHIRRFGTMARTALLQPSKAIGTLRTQLASLLPSITQLKTRGQSLASTLRSQVMPVLGGAGLAGAATALGVAFRGPLMGAIGGLGGRLVGLANNSQRLLTAWWSLRTSAVGLIRSLKGKLLPVLTRFKPIITTVLSPVKRLGLLLAGPLLSAISSFGGALVALLPSLGTAGTALTALISPIGLLVAAVAGLYLAWKTNLFGIRDIGKQVFSAIKALITGDFGTAQQRFQKATNMMGVSWKKNIKPLIASAKRIFSTIKTVVGNAMSWLMTNAVRPVLRSLTRLWEQNGQRIMASVKELFSVLKTAFKVGVGVLLVAWNTFGDEILAVTKFLFDTVGSVINTALDVIITAFDVFTDVLTGDWEGALNKLLALGKRIFGGIMNFVRKWGSGFIGWVSSLVSQFIGWFQDLYRRLIGGSIIPDLFSDIISAARSFGSNILGWVASLIGQWIGNFRTFGSNVLSWLSSLAGQFIGGLRSLGSNVLGWVSSLVGQFFSSFQGLGSDLIGWVTSLGGQLISGFRQIGSNILGWAGSLVDQLVTKLTEAGGKMVEGVKGAFNEKMPDKFSIPSVSVAGKEIGGGSIDLPSLDVGGTLQSDGLYYGHAGETVVPADASTPYSGGQSTTGSNQQPQNITLQLDGDAVTDLLRGEAVEVTRDELEAERKDIQAQRTK